MSSARTIAITHQPSPQIVRCELTFIERHPIDYARLVDQHAGYCALLRSEGCDVVTLDDNIELPDSVFVEDTAVVLDEVAIITSPGAASRRGEVDAIEGELRKHRETRRIRSPATLDGGDVVQVGRSILIGVSSRTNLEGVRSFAEIATLHGYSVSPVSVNGALHLKTACCALPDGRLLINPEWMRGNALAEFDTVAVPSAEPWAADVLLVGDTVCLPEEHPRTGDMLADLGFGIRTTPLSEFAKAEGGITCLSLLVRTPD